MKRIKSFLLLLAYFMLLTGFSPLPNETEINNVTVSGELEEHGFPKYVSVNGKKQDVRVVTWDEYYNDKSDDLLIILDYETTYEEVSSSKLQTSISQPTNNHDTEILFLGEVLVFVGKTIVGRIIGDAFVYSVQSGIAKTVALKAFAAISTIIPYAALAVIGVAYAYTVYETIKGIVTVTSLQNRDGCVWNGPRIGGRWICPFRIYFDPIYGK